MLLSLRRLPPTSTLFPYTTLFRSRRVLQRAPLGPAAAHRARRAARRRAPRRRPARRARQPRVPLRSARLDPAARSEEHTSELQSLRHLVCRLLLEKKKYKTTISTL